MKSLYYTNFFVVIGLLSFASCSKQNKHTHMLTKPSLQSSQDSVISDKPNQAKHIETPFPVGAVLSKQEQTDNTLFLAGNSTLQLTKVKEFYLHEMERLGWDITDISSQDEGTLVCNKTSKCCVISLRNNASQHTTIHLFIKSQADSEEISTALSHLSPDDQAGLIIDT